MTKSFRAKVTVPPGEAYVVAPIYFWDNMIEIYNEYARKAKDSEERKTWLEAADFVERWIQETAVEEDNSWPDN